MNATTGTEEADKPNHHNSPSTRRRTVPELYTLTSERAARSNMVARRTAYDARQQLRGVHNARRRAASAPCAEWADLQRREHKGMLGIRHGEAEKPGPGRRQGQAQAKKKGAQPPAKPAKGKAEKGRKVKEEEADKQRAAKERRQYENEQLDEWAERALWATGENKQGGGS